MFIKSVSFSNLVLPNVFNILTTNVACLLCLFIALKVYAFVVGFTDKNSSVISLSSDVKKLFIISLLVHFLLHTAMSTSYIV